MIKTAARVSRTKCNNQKTIDITIYHRNENLSLISQYTKDEIGKWKTVEQSKDPKELWRKIDWQGKLNCDTPKSSNSINEYADFLEERCSLPVEHTFYVDIETKVFNPITDNRNRSV